MKTSATVLLTVTCALLVLGSHLAVAQEIPSGVRYKPASETLNSSAKVLLEEAFKNPKETPRRLLNGTLTCGPTLWMDIKSGARPELQQSKPIDVFLELPEVIRTEARAMLNGDQRSAFWSALIAKHPELTGAQVRKANAVEIRYYWATIPFDIEEPFFAVDAGAKKFVAHFQIEDGTPVLFWFDRIGDLKALGSPQPAPNADTAAADAVVGMIRPDWTRYRFSYDGGLTVSALLPQAPTERADIVRIRAEPEITLMGRSISSGSEGMSFTLFYTSQLSRNADHLTDSERNSVLAAMAGPWLNGMVRAMAEDGKQVQPEAGPIQPTTLGKYSGLQQELSIPPFRCRVRVVMAGQYTYGALVTWNANESDNLPQFFLDSLRIED